MIVQVQKEIERAEREEKKLREQLDKAKKEEHEKQRQVVIIIQDIEVVNMIIIQSL